MRGKAFSALVQVFSNGITPAYAGKSQRQAERDADHRDHPRLCGEKIRLGDRGVCVIWITPAYAGKSTQFQACGTVGQDHPRLCGEKDFRIKFYFIHIRITPAYAGKSLKLLSCFLVDQDHPRLCGEKYLRKIDYIATPGSPPPMRGKGPECSLDLTSLRITPAYAGKSLVIVSPFGRL